MAIAYRGAVVNSANNGGDVALNLTTISGLATNDVVILAYSIGDNDGTDFTMDTVPTTGTSGWTKIADLHAEDDDDCDLGVFWKRMGASVDTSVTVDGQGGTDAAVAAVAVAFSGVNTTTALDVSTTTNTGTDSANADPPSIDWSTAGTAVVMAIAAAHDAAGTFTFPAGYTTNAQQRGQEDTTDTTVGIGYKLAPSDPENPAAATHSNTATTASWCAATIALRAQGVTAESKTGDDTGTLTEGRPTIALSSQSDTGTAGEGQPAIAESVTDTGTLAETGTFTALATATDTGTLYSGLTISAAELAPYGGTLSEVGEVSVPKADTDTGTLADAGSNAALATSGHVVEVSDIKAALTAVVAYGVDTGTAAETGTASAIAADTDTGTLDDTGTANATASYADTDAATLADTGAATVTANYAVDTDAGTLADDGAITTAANLGVDTGTLAEAITGVVVTADADTGTLDDTGAIVPSGGTTPEDTDALTLADAEVVAVTALWATGVDAGTLDDTGASYASAPSGDGTESLTLADTGVVVETTIGGTPVVAAAPSTSYTMMMPRTKDFLMPRASEKWLLREQGTVEITPVAPATPPNPFGWLAEAGDEDLVAVALLG